MSAGVLSVTIAEKRYGSSVILANVSLEVRAGECLAITGPSGRGKSTLLRVAAGLDPAFSGTRWLAPSARLTMVFQDPRLLPWRTTLEQLRLCRPAGGDAAICAALGAVGVLEAASKFPAQLSVGMQRRVALARALVVEPDVLILDEAFASLDAATAEVVRAVVQAECQRRALAVVMATHNPDDLALAQRVLAL